MTHEVFISYSHHDKLIADAVCANLEGAGIRCWIAPRDIAPGHDWPTAISEAISKSRVMVLIFSSRSNTSKDVGRELILAANSNCVIVPFKIENIEPEPGKKYYLARTHWLDAMDPPTQEQIDKLVSCVRTLLVEAGVQLAPQPSPENKTAAEIVQPPPPVVQAEVPPVEKKKEEKPPVLESIKQSTPVHKTQPPRRKRTPFAWAIVGVVTLVGLILVGIKYIPSLVVQPTPTPTFTPTHQPSLTPTRTTQPSPTATALPAWVTDFARPILDAIADQPPTFQDDFGLASAGWTSNSWCGDRMDLRDGELVVPGCTGVSHSGMDSPDFVVEVDGRFLPDVTGGGYWDIGYRGLSCAGCSISIDYNGSVNIGGFSDVDDIDLPDSALPGYQTNHLLMIAKGDEYAFYLNGQPLYYFKDDSSRWGGVVLSVSRFRNLPESDPVFVAFDNLKLWDIYDLP